MDRLPGDENIDERRRRIELALRPWFVFGTPVVAGAVSWLVYGPVTAGIAFGVSALALGIATRTRGD